MGAASRIPHSPLPTLLDVLHCEGTTMIHHGHGMYVNNEPAERCHAFAKFRCKKCAMLLCEVHGRHHDTRCVKLNGA